MFKIILVATDGSNHAYRGLEIPSDMAVRYDARRIILHVQMHGVVPPGFRQMDQATHSARLTESVNPAPYNYPGNLSTAFNPPDGDSCGDHYYEYLGNSILNDSKAKALQQGVRLVETEIARGDTADSIVSFAEAENADIVVIGTPGPGYAQEISDRQRRIKSDATGALPLFNREIDKYHDP